MPIYTIEDNKTSDKSKIPYLFETPIPKYFREHGWFDNEHTFKFVTWAFSRCHIRPHVELIYGKEINLAPYEFLASRLSSPQECFLSENIFRNQLISMQKANLLKKTTNCLTNKYTCYIWLTDSFCKMNNQQNNQQGRKKITNRQPTPLYKSESEENIAIIAKKEASKKKEKIASSPFSPKSPLFQKEKKNEDIEVIQAFYEAKGLEFTSKDLELWLKKYGSDYLTGTIQLLLKRQTKPSNWTKTVQAALSGSWLTEEQNSIENREFAIKFKAENNWSELHITKKYCTDAQTSRDFQFKQDPQEFRNYFKKCFFQHQENVS